MFKQYVSIILRYVRAYYEYYIELSLYKKSTRFQNYYNKKIIQYNLSKDKPHINQYIRDASNIYYKLGRFPVRPAPTIAGMISDFYSAKLIKESANFIKKTKEYNSGKEK